MSNLILTKFEDQLNSEGFNQLALTSQEVYRKLQSLLQKATTPQQARLISYSLLTLAYECCQEAFGSELPLQMNEEYSDKLQSIVNDQQLKQGIFVT